MSLNISPKVYWDCQDPERLNGVNQLLRKSKTSQEVELRTSMVQGVILHQRRPLYHSHVAVVAEGLLALYEQYSKCHRSLQASFVFHGPQESMVSSARHLIIRARSLVGFQWRVWMEGRQMVLARYWQIHGQLYSGKPKRHGQSTLFIIARGTLEAWNISARIHFWIFLALMIPKWLRGSSTRIGPGLEVLEGTAMYHRNAQWPIMWPGTSWLWLKILNGSHQVLSHERKNMAYGKHFAVIILFFAPWLSKNDETFVCPILSVAFRSGQHPI